MSPHTFSVRSLLTGLILFVSVGVLRAQETVPGLPQAGELAGQSLRPYWHVFIAYAIAIVLVAAWIVSISKRLSEVEERLGD